ncbi:MAG: hypothetical protein ABIZ56_06010 [Chthoniobacteraceae bacterium]
MHHARSFSDFAAAFSFAGLPAAAKERAEAGEQQHRGGRLGQDLQIAERVEIGRVPKEAGIERGEAEAAECADGGAVQDTEEIAVGRVEAVDEIDIEEAVEAEGAGDVEMRSVLFAPKITLFTGMIAGLRPGEKVALKTTLVKVPKPFT